MTEFGTKGSDGFEPPKYLASLIAAVNDGAKAAQGGALFFALVGVYLLATAFSASDEDLLRGRAVTISQIGASLPVSFSFAIAPFAFVFLHIYTLVRYDMLAANVRQFLAELQRTVPWEVDRERCRQLLANVEFIHALVAPRGSRQYSPVWRWLVWGVVAIFPVFVLLLVQINALRYQSALITRVQQFGLLLDLSALVWFFHRAPLDGSAAQRESRLAKARHWANLIWLPAIVMGLNLVYVNVAPAEADVRLFRYVERQEEEPSNQPTSTSVQRTLRYLADALDNPLDVVFCPSLQWGCRYLNVAQRTLVDHVWDEKAIVDLRGGSRSLANALAAVESLVLRGRSLRFAELAGGLLPAADLNGSDLRNATLRGARLPGAQLLGAQLQGADMAGANLQGASLIGAQLQGADLTGTQLQGATLVLAQLQGANLRGAQLQGANLNNAELQGASLDFANLQSAILDGAYLEGAGLVGAQLQGAWLSLTQLQGASLRRVQLQGASLNHTFVWRADVRDANGEGTLVVSPETAPKYLSLHCSSCKPSDWSPSSFAALKQLIEQQVRKGFRPDQALKQIAVLDPTKVVPEEEVWAKAWADLSLSSPSRDDHDQIAAKWLRATICDARWAPFEIRQLLLFHDLFPYRFAEGSPQPAALATSFLDEVNCPGSRGLSDEEKYQLQVLRDRPAPALAPMTPK